MWQHQPKPSWKKKKGEFTLFFHFYFIITDRQDTGLRSYKSGGFSHFGSVYPWWSSITSAAGYRPGGAGGGGRHGMGGARPNAE